MKDDVRGGVGSCLLWYRSASNGRETRWASCSSRDDKEFVPLQWGLKRQRGTDDKGIEIDYVREAVDHALGYTGDEIERLGK